jgi:hypothetical protein
MEENKKELNELFALPIGLRPVVRLDGNVLYSSDNLIQSYLGALEDSSTIGVKHIHIFRKLVNEGRILPCFKTKGFADLLFWKIFGPSHQQNILAFYEPTAAKKVFILLANNINFFAYTSNEWMAQLTVHECMHMLADYKKNQFIVDFKVLLIQFYRSIWTNIFSLDPQKVTDDDVFSIVSFMFNEIERKVANITDETIGDYYNLLAKVFTTSSTLNDRQLKEKIIKYLTITKIFLISDEQFYSAKGKFSDILNPMGYFYRNNFKVKTVPTECIQELLYPSEVIAIASESSKYKDYAISLLRGL